MSIIFPEIDPVAISIGPVSVHWYALSYVAGILLAWLYIGKLDKEREVFSQKAYDDFIVWAILGILLGGRLGYVLFYNLGYYVDNPVDILKLWQGGMSFHGGLLGSIFSIYLMCKKYKLEFWKVVDVISCAAPIGLFFGRVANFVNAELWGRYAPADLPWGVIFPNQAFPRHPSQLYEALLEGLVLFLILLFVVYKTQLRQKAGALSGIFILGYGVFRAFVEFYRQPDAQIGYILNIMTMGQILCIPMILVGLYLICRKSGIKK